MPIARGKPVGKSEPWGSAWRVLVGGIGLGGAFSFRDIGSEGRTFFDRARFGDLGSVRQRIKHGLALPEARSAGRPPRAGLIIDLDRGRARATSADGFIWFTRGQTRAATVTTAAGAGRMAIVDEVNGGCPGVRLPWATRQTFPFLGAHRAKGGDGLPGQIPEAECGGFYMAPFRAVPGSQESAGCSQVPTSPQTLPAPGGVGPDRRMADKGPARVPPQDVR